MNYKFWIMKKLLMICLAIMALTGCETTQTVTGTDGRPLSKEESQRIVKNTIASKVENRSYRILVDEMTPTGGPLMRLRDDDWALEIHNDSIGSVLPYVGRGYNMPYGSAMGLHFITRIDSYTQEKTKADLWRIEITCHTDKDSYKYNVDIYDNGKAYITVQSNYRDIVKFGGDVDVRDVKLVKVED